MTMKLHILNVLYDLESHAKDGRCGLSRDEDIRRCVGKLVEKQTLDLRFSLLSSRSLSDSEVCVRHFHLIVWSLIFTYKT